MKKLIIILKFGFIVLSFFVVLASCERYLDKAPEAEYDDKTVFGNFRSFQGWVEQMYACITDHEKAGNWSQYLLADETLSFKTIYEFDRGNYWASNRYFFVEDGEFQAGTRPPDRLPSPRNLPNFPNMIDRKIWDWAWYAIAVANLTIEKLGEEGLFVGTEEEHDLLLGQAYYFRAWFYFEICRFWGGMPYISRTLKADEDWGSDEFGRKNFQKTALQMAQDFRVAAKLLPVHWDLAVAGKNTQGMNRDRANKVMALGYLGKTFLFAASPMINEEAGNGNQFNAALCDSAAHAFEELLILVDKDLHPDNYELFHLQTWENYTENFYQYGDKQKPGQVEGIMMPTIYKSDGTWWNGGRAILPICLDGLWEEDVPSHNLVQNFGDDRGYPLVIDSQGLDTKDPDSPSQYSGDNPWENRDPRFYKVICHDGEKFNAQGGYLNMELSDKSYINGQYLHSYRGGIHGSPNPFWEAYSITSYYQKKFNGLFPEFTISEHAEHMQAYVPFLRLADVYMMYAEAVNWKTNGGPKATSSPNFHLTAVEAINKIRQRDLSAAEFMNPVPDKFTVNKEVFFEEIVRERCVEFCFEGQRFDDLRRWNRNYDPRYLNKTRFLFDRDDKFSENPKPINQSVVTVVRRVAEKKHNWLPLQRTWVQMNPNFYQNPGW